MFLTGVWALSLNKRAKKDSEIILNALQIVPGNVIADIGSGGGYFTFEFAQITGSGGKVFAVDTNKTLLEGIKKKAHKKHLSNIEIVIGQEDGCPLPEESCDLIFMRNSFHHIEDPVIYFQKLKKSVKPGGRIAIIDWEGKVHSYVGFAGHTTPETEILNVFNEIGFEHLESFDFLDGQSFNIFRK